MFFIVCDLEGKLNEWIKLFKNKLKSHQTLFIIDDCSPEGEINKKRDALSELAFSGRHRNHSLWVLTQKYNSVSKQFGTNNTFSEDHVISAKGLR